MTDSPLVDRKINQKQFDFLANYLSSKYGLNIPAEKKAHYLQPAVGHYGVFNGSRFRAEIAPRIADFVLSHNNAQPAPSKVA